MDKTYAKELALLERIKEHLESGKMAKSLEVTDEDELSLLKEYNLLTYKPVIYAANVSEDDLADDGAANEMSRTVRFSLSVQKSKKRSLNWMMMRRQCSWMIWD